MNGSLRTELEAEAGLVDVPPGDLDAVVRRGRHRRQRARRATAGVAALAVLAGGFAASRAGQDGPGTSAIAEGGATAGDSGIVWERTDLDPKAALGAFSGGGSTPVEVGGANYALSTGPGVRWDDSGEVPPRIVWRSDDGVEWAPADGPAFRPNDLAAAGERLYAIGTGQATAAGDPDVRVGWSDGGDWAEARLPIDLDAIAEHGTYLSVTGEDVAAGEAGVVAVARVGVTLDVPSLGVEAPHGWAIEDDGVAILGEGDPCPDSPKEMRPPEGEEPGAVYCFDEDGNRIEPATVEERRTWDELGVEGDLLDAVQRRPFVFHAPDVDAPFERVELPFDSQLVSGGGDLTVDGSGFNFVATGFDGDRAGPGRLVSLRSADGRTWEAGPEADDVSWVLAVGDVDGRLALVGTSEQGEARYAELVDGQWLVTDLGDLREDDACCASPVAAAIGPLGVIVGVTVVDEGKEDVRSELLSSRDGRTWSVERVEELVEDERVSVGGILVREDRAVVSLGLLREGQPSRTIALVGTPR